MYGQRAARFLATFALLLSACAFKPNLGDGQVRCGNDGRCPPSQHCEDDGLCYGPPTTAGGTCVPGHCFVGWCGLVNDGCGQKIDCGPCNPVVTADLGAPHDLANCTPAAHCVPGESCGDLDDGCGNVLHCGDCPTPGSCSSSAPNRCACTPHSCADVHANCGALPDGCGGVNDCFPAGQTRCPARSGICGGGGPYVCGLGSGCKALTACPAGACGLIPDGCRSYLDCRCPAGHICGGGGKPNVCN